MNVSDAQLASPSFSQRPGLVNLDAWTTIRVLGKDRAAFLHNMCTNDVRGLAEGDGCEAFFTDVKGKIIAHAFVLAARDEHWLIAAPGRGPKLVAHLDRYVIREDVQLLDETTERVWTLLSGEGSAGLLGRLAGQELGDFSTPWRHRELDVGGIQVLVARCDLPWPGGFLLGARRDGADGLRGALQAAGAPMCGEGDWLALRVESGWPLEGVDFGDANLPQEVGRDAQAIHFRKGCYLGQETIARIDALGHVNKHLATVRLAGAGLPEAGAELVADGQPVGRMTSIAWSPILNAAIGLAMIKRGFHEPGQELTCGDRQAHVIATPAVQPAGQSA